MSTSTATVAAARARQKAQGYKHVSLPIQPDLVKPVDELVASGEYPNRTEALNALIRGGLQQKEMSHA